VETGEVYQCEHRVKMASGDYRWHLSRGVPVRDERGKIIRWYGTATDIHAMKRHTDQLERSNRDLQEFAFVASHDLQEPLRKIEILGDLLIESAANLDMAQRDRLARMRSAASRMRAMLDGLLQYSLSTAQALELEPLGLSEIITAVLVDLEPRLRQAGACVELGPLPVVAADPAQLRLLFHHLIDNALKFQSPGGEPRVKLSARLCTPDQVEILVEDNGIGFDPGYAGRLFQPFQRLGRWTEYAGDGIGLAICRRIVERHGGGITARSTPGQGACFILTLPTRHNDERGN
jgi:light-regulated signal transduction histidine kinase (bacteriophytochrome)